MRYLAGLLIILITSASSLHAETTDDLAVKYADAAAYFLIVHQCMKQSGEKYAEVSKGYEDQFTLCCKVSMRLARQTRDPEMAVKVTLSRVEYSKKEMQKEMGHKNENISILINKYGGSSTELMTNPPKTLIQIYEGLDGVQK